MLLYPQLPPTIARAIADEFSSKSIESLLTLSNTRHLATIYAPTGGNRVTEPHLQEIDRLIREKARSFGYPARVEDLKMRNFDASSGRILHEMLDITPSEASNSGIWAFMACVLWPDIVRWRFPGNTDGTSRERFAGGRRNAFGRLWCRAYILKDLKNNHPYELLDLLGEDELVQITERPRLAGSPPLVKEVCKIYIRIINEYSDIPQSRSLLRDVMKRLRRLLPMVSFDALDDQTLRQLIEEIFTYSIQSLKR